MTRNIVFERIDTYNPHFYVFRRLHVWWCCPKSMAGDQLPLRVITAAAIFDGHDAAIGIFRRILQSQGCEVIHLGHDRGADEVARAAIKEDAHAIAITSYQGGAVEMFTHTTYILEE